MPLHIDDVLVGRLIAGQFPVSSDLTIVPVLPGGRDNRTFRLGADMLVRLPSAAGYAAQVEMEQHWLPRLAPSLPLAIPAPLAIGQPAEDYPWKWSVYRWLDGKPPTKVDDLSKIAASLGQFLIALQRVGPTGGPAPGTHNFYRGGALSIYDAQTRQAIAALKGQIDVGATTKEWEAALASEWRGPPVRVHGDIAAANLLVQDGQLSAIIDFGQSGVGDPGCDLSIARTMFRDESRETFAHYFRLMPKHRRAAAAGHCGKP